MMQEARHVSAVAALATISGVLIGCQEKLAEVVAPAAIDGYLTIGPENEIGKQIMSTCDADMSMADLTTKMWWPTCETPDDPEKCTKACFSVDLIKEMDAFNKEHGGKLVTYKSRPGKDKEGKDIEVVQLKGWWLPAPGATADTPRIVVQHGFKSNGNKVRVQVAAYLLRKLGYSVLVNNLRDHCYSDKSKLSLIGWGHAYPLDMLGAWDYLKDEAADPIDASKVGILGFSMGGFITANAFGMEDKVPGAWIDGAPFTPRDGFEAAFAGEVGKLAGAQAGDVGQSLGEWVGGHISDETWDAVEEEAAKKGADLNSHIPEEQLLEGSDTKRPVYVTANKHDKTVPIESTSKYVELFKKNDAKYDLKGYWEQDDVCGDQGGHCFGHLIYTEEYEAKLCTFWSGVFGTEASCGDDVAGDDDSDAETKLFETGHWSFRAAQSNTSSMLVASLMAVAAATGLVALGRRLRAQRSLVNESDQEGLILDEE